MQLVTRALSVLQALSERPDGLGLQDLHENLEIPIGSMHRVLAALSEEGFVSRSPSNLRYFIGPATRRLAERKIGESGGIQALAPFVRELAVRTGETVFLTEMQGSDALCVFIVEGTYPLRLFVRLGQSMPLNAAAAARVLLAYLEPSDASELLNSQKFTDFRTATPHTAAEVIVRLPLIREHGFDVADDELDAGVWAVAAPIFTSTGRVTASLTLAGAAGRLKVPETQASVIRDVVEGAASMSRELGWTA